MYNILQLRLALAVNGHELERAMQDSSASRLSELLTQRASLKDMLIDKLLTELGQETSFDKAIEQMGTVPLRKVA